MIPSNSATPFISQPPEIFFEIFIYIPEKEVARLSRTCTVFKKNVDTPPIKKYILSEMKIREAICSPTQSLCTSLFAVAEARIQELRPQVLRSIAKTRLNKAQNLQQERKRPPPSLFLNYHSLNHSSRRISYRCPPC